MLVQLLNDWLCLDVYGPSNDSCHLLCSSPRHVVASDSGLLGSTVDDEESKNWK